MVGREEDTVAIVEGTVRVNSVLIPLGPPASGGVGFITVISVARKKMDVVTTGSNWVGTTGVGGGGLVEVDLDEVPMWADGTVGGIRDEEETIA